MIPRKWSNQTLAATAYLRSLPSLDGVSINRVKGEAAKQVVLDTEPQQLETPISRRVTILLEAWVLKPNGDADVYASYRLMDDVLHELQLAPQRLTHVAGFEQPAGPRVVKDDIKTEYHEGSIVWIVTQ